MATEGRIIERRFCAKSWEIGTKPATGNQCSFTAKIRMKKIASTKFGIEIIAKETAEEAVSMMRRGLYAE